jgi:dTDP-glucose 4,6-dehydratase
MIFVTGGCGFIGSCFVLDWLRGEAEPLLNIDALTYAGHLGNLQEVAHHPNYRFVHADIRDAEAMQELFLLHKPRAVVHFAAESHVDRSIAAPSEFVETNVMGTVNLLKAAQALVESGASPDFRFVHVSTDEVFGSLEPHEPPFAESNRYEPNSPYSASKAASDHFVRAWWHTFHLPTITTNCSNNYGPRQFPEKLIPLVIHNALRGEALPVYGDGLQVRDWLHVSDHCAALRAVLARGEPGQTYNIGGRSELPNVEVVRAICGILDELRPTGTPYMNLIKHVTDRRGHDRRYAIDDTRIATQLGWQPAISFAEGIRQTVQWYLDHQDWVESVTSGAYRTWVEQQYPSTRRA